MKLGKNVIANYISQIYVTLISIIMLPMYIKYMGEEAYGLIGFFAMLQAWFTLLDLGLTPTVSRETARFRGGLIDSEEYRRVVGVLERVFFAVGTLVGALLFFSSSYISHKWLKISVLSIQEVRNSIELMSLIFALRWACGLYRGIISGSERFVWLGGYNVLLGTFHFVLVLPLLIFFSSTPTAFFSFQLIVTAIELIGLMVFSYKLLPSASWGRSWQWSWASLRPILKFSLTISLTSSMWVLATQTDKLVLSKTLPLAEYGFFTIAVLVANGVTIVTSPISGAIMPRMAKLVAEGNHEKMIDVYRTSTQMVALIGGAAAVTITFCADYFLWSWTGDKVLANDVAPVLVLYALGNGIVAVGAFPYYLQYAMGDLRLHLFGSILFIFVLVPSMIIAAIYYGSVGTGWVWLAVNLLSFLGWLPVIHNRFVPGLNFEWYTKDIGIIYITIMAVGFGLNKSLSFPDNRSYCFITVMVFGFLLILAGAIASSQIRMLVRKWLCKQINRYSLFP